MKINRVFDVIGPRGPVPNGLNWNYTDTFWDYNFYIYHKLIDAFNKKYTQLSINSIFTDINKEKYCIFGLYD